VIPGVVTPVGATATFNPTSNLAAGTLYTATITTGVTDLAGNALASTYVWTFTTGSAADTIRPFITSTIPHDTATGIAVNANVSAVFSEAMNPLTITTTTFTLRQGATLVAGAVTSPSTTTATFNPTSDLANNTVYTATITTGVKDLAGNAMAVTRPGTSRRSQLVARDHYRSTLVRRAISSCCPRPGYRPPGPPRSWEHGRQPSRRDLHHRVRVDHGRLEHLRDLIAGDRESLCLGLLPADPGVPDHGHQ